MEATRPFGKKGFTETQGVRSIIGKYVPDEMWGFKNDGRVGLKHFIGLTPKDAKAILKLCPSLKNEAQNNSPTWAEFIALAEDCVGMTFHGYLIPSTRADERITIEGFNVTSGAKAICAKHNLRPDELSDVRAWWD